jgi:hypothetical protein
LTRASIDQIFQNVDILIHDLDKFVRTGANTEVQKFRYNLAGLLVVTMVASFENSVKHVIINYAHSRNKDFGSFSERHFGKINGKVRIDDLKKYCLLFGEDRKDNFVRILESRRKKIRERARLDINASYDQIIDRRHSFAHTWAVSLTIEEAICQYRAAKRVIYAFGEAFDTQQ